MLPTHTRPAVIHLLIPLTAGAAAFAVLWVLGAEEFGWLGFLAAALVWSALSRDADPDEAGDDPWPPGEQPVSTAAFSAGATASTWGAPLADAPVVPAGRYLLDPQRTRVRIRARKLGFLTVRGSFTRASGIIDVDEVPARCRITAAVTSASLRTGNPYRDSHVVGPAFLDAVRHPALRYEGSPAAVDPAGRWTVSGHLTVKGVTRPATFSTGSITAVESGHRLRFTAETTISRRSFGVTGYGWLAGDEVKVRVEGEARRAERV